MIAMSEVAAFEEARSGLLGLAYRMLGSRADAEDVVQDTFLKWQQSDRDAIDNPAAWLTTVCTRRCMDVLKSHQRSRTDYVGTWLPEPLDALPDGGADPLLVSSLSTAFLLMLERLTPRERAAYLLHEIFETPYPDTARMLGVAETACRKLVSRARDRVHRPDVRHVTPEDRQRELLDAFRQAIASGRTERLAALMSEDIELHHDSGGKVPAVTHFLRGRAAVLDLVETFLHRVWRREDWQEIRVNGQLALAHRDDEQTLAVLSFGYDEAGRATDIFIVRNPDKLAGLRPR